MQLSSSLLVILNRHAEVTELDSEIQH